jgi:putative flippase GtrA
MNRLSPFFRFLLTGGIAAGVNIFARILLSNIFSFETAVAVAYLFGMSTAYLLARCFVFERSDRTVTAEYLRFAAVNAVAIVQVWLVSVGLANKIFPAVNLDFHPELLAHIIGVTSTAVTSYFGHKLFTFRPARSSPTTR